MSFDFLNFLKEKLSGEPPVHPLDRRMAKRWVKERLKKMYPSLRNDPQALDRAYEQLGLEARVGSGKGGSTVYVISLPDEES